MPHLSALTWKLVEAEVARKKAGAQKIEKSAYIVCAVIAIAKLVFGSTNEIIAIPNDSVNYVQHSLKYLREIGGPPGYPFWLALSAQIGLPQRVSIECLYLLSSFFFSTTIRRVIHGCGYVLLFFLLSFLPTTYFLFDNALADGFYACLSLIALAFSCRILIPFGTRPRVLLWDKLGLGGVLGYMLITRNEDALIIAWIVVLASCEFLENWRHTSFRLALRPLLFTSLTLVCIAFSFNVMIAGYHAVTKKVYARTLPTLPSHVQLLNNLASIDSGSPRVNRIPISAEARMLAYKASPTLRRLATKIEDPNSMYQKASAKSGIAVGEIGAGWIWHVFNDAALQSLDDRSLYGLNEFYRKINSELEEAFESGRLKRRVVLHPLLGGEIKSVILAIPGRILSLFLRSFESTNYSQDLGYAAEKFDAACLRRKILTILGGPVRVVSGWAYVREGSSKIAKIQVGSYQEAYGSAGAMWQDANRVARKDVEIGLSKDRQGREVVGFEAKLPNGLGDRFVVRYLLEDHSVALTVPVERNTISSVPVGAARVVQGIDLDGVSEFERARSAAVREKQEILRIYRYIAPKLAFFVFIAGGLIVVSQAIFRNKYPAHFSLVLLLAGLLLPRLIFFGFIDASGWEVEVRYLAPVSVVIVIALVLAAAYVVKGIYSFVTPAH